MAEPADFVAITNAFVDPRGSDVAAQGGEFLVVANLGEDAADVGGWTIRDRAGAVVRVPAGRSIPGGGRLEVHSGPGQDDAGRIYAGRGRAVLTNPGDTVQLFDGDGRHRQTFTYRGQR